MGRARRRRATSYDWVGSDRCRQKLKFSEILLTMKLQPQFLHSYRSPSVKPGVSHVILQVGQVVRGRLELRLAGIECSVCIVSYARLETRDAETEQLLRRSG